MSTPPRPTQTCGHGLFGFLDCGSGVATEQAGDTVDALVAALTGSFASLGIQLLVFLILRLRLSRIYRPRSYLVSEKERVPPPAGGLIGWLYPLFSTNNLTLIQKCGLDAYFFLRFLQMSLKIFFPAALLLLPILLPINHTAHGTSVGLDKYSISNIGPSSGHRLWAHCILAIVFIVWFFYVTYTELRGYIRIRQAFLTSPQHRIRASATTVLVTGIPRKWLALEALSGLYDVFPGGVRDIWINRNYDELAEKIKLREKVVKKLETAETGLIKLCRKKNAKTEKKKAKEEGLKQKSNKEKKEEKAEEDAEAERIAQSQGFSAGEKHHISRKMQAILSEGSQQQERLSQNNHSPFGPAGQGFDAIGHGIDAFGKGIGRFGKGVAGGVDQGFHKAGGDLNRFTAKANTGQGFVADDSLYSSTVRDRSPTAKTFTPSPPQQETLNSALQASSMDNDRRSVAPHPLATSPTMDGTRSDQTLEIPSTGSNRPSSDSKLKESLQKHEPPQRHVKRNIFLEIFKNRDQSLALPSPQPHMAEESEFPLRPENETLAGGNSVDTSKRNKLMFWKWSNDGKHEKPKEYGSAVNQDCDEDQDEEPYWRKYIEPKNRETIRLPLFAKWFPSLPFVGKKVDKIYHLRRELARLNLEIESDQDDMDKYPLMNSAFIQFNHQVAAHMCCQSVSHHVPQQMAPRLVEISPNDVIWDNMAVKWWERILRTGIVGLVCAGLIILYAIPVAFTSLLNNVAQLAAVVPWLSWLNTTNSVVKAIIQGILPPILLSLILLLVPIIFRLLAKQQGVPTGTSKELGVQTWYFTFLFIQVFFVVTLAGGLTNFFTDAATNPGSVVRELASNLPKGSNYFFSYLTVQALSNSASALVQIWSLISWFILAPAFDSTARSKWKRQVELNNVQWGTFFPPFTNFAVIGVIYSIISPLILVFMIFIFGLFWIVYRYNVLFVFQFKNETGGLLFPVAINQLFTGLYFLELCLIGLFFTLTDTNHDIICLPQAIIMIVVLILTIAYQWLVYSAFKPLTRYLPITLEDEAVIRDEEFARAQASRFASPNQGEDKGTRNPYKLEDDDHEEASSIGAAIDMEKRQVRASGEDHPLAQSPEPEEQEQESFAKQDESNVRKRTQPVWATEKWKNVAPEAMNTLRFLADGKRAGQQRPDPESQRTVGDVLFSGFADELEDLNPQERDVLVRYAFQHSALRARRPVVWIPRDALGVSDDEIRRAENMSTTEVVSHDGSRKQKVNISMSNEGTALDSKGRVVFRRSPPDFSNVDLIAL